MWKPDVTVAAICEHENHFLLVEERSKSSGEVVFNQPAGHLDEGESIYQAVIRETREETQRHFTPEALVGLYRHEAANGKTYIRYTFCGKVSKPDAALTLDADIIKTHWLSYRQIKAMTNLRSPLVLECVEHYLAGERYPLTLLHEL